MQGQSFCIKGKYGDQKMTKISMLRAMCGVQLNIQKRQVFDVDAWFE